MQALKIHTVENVEQVHVCVSPYIPLSPFFIWGNKYATPDLVWALLGYYSKCVAGEYTVKSRKINLEYRKYTSIKTFH